MSNFLTDSPLGLPNWLLFSGTVVGALVLKKVVNRKTETEEESFRSPVGPSPALQEPTKEGQADLRFLAQQAGLDDEWVTYLEATAAGESGFNNLSAMGNPTLSPPWAKVRSSSTEAAAARIAYDRNAHKYVNCLGYASSVAKANRYSFGSGGWFAELPTNFVVAFKDTKYACIDPWSVFEPAASIVMVLEYSRRVMRRPAFKANPTWVNLRVGHASPASMNKPDALNRQRLGKNKFGDRLLQIGQSRSFMERPVTPLPSFDPAGMLEHLEKF